MPHILRARCSNVAVQGCDATDHRIDTCKPEEDLNADPWYVSCQWLPIPTYMAIDHCGASVQAYNVDLIDGSYTSFLGWNNMAAKVWDPITESWYLSVGPAGHLHAVYFDVGTATPSDFDRGPGVFPFPPRWSLSKFQTFLNTESPPSELWYDVGFGVQGWLRYMVPVLWARRSNGKLVGIGQAKLAYVHPVAQRFATDTTYYNCCQSGDGTVVPWWNDTVAKTRWDASWSNDEQPSPPPWSVYGQAGRLTFRVSIDSDTLADAYAATTTIDVSYRLPSIDMSGYDPNLFSWNRTHVSCQYLSTAMRWRFVKDPYSSYFRATSYLHQQLIQSGYSGDPQSGCFNAAVEDWEFWAGPEDGYSNFDYTYPAAHPITPAWNAYEPWVDLWTP